MSLSPPLTIPTNKFPSDVLIVKGPPLSPLYADVLDFFIVRKSLAQDSIVTSVLYSCVNEDPSPTARLPHPETVAVVPDE